ncbi:MAG: hypothetical protein ACOH10_07725 [Rhodoglobus sp.]
MSARDQQTENKSAKPAADEDKAAASEPKAADKVDMFEGSYEDREDGTVQFTSEVNLEVPAGTTGARTRVLIAPVGMIQPKAWLDQKRDLYNG